MNSVVINGSFYSLQRPTSYRSWAAATPDDFVFAVKGARYITHLKQLHDVDAALANFFASGMLALGSRPSPAPGVAAAQPLSHVLEPRHPSFESAEAHDLLREHDVAMVIADSAGLWPTMSDATTGIRYVRLHGETELYTSAYSDAALDRWAGYGREWLGRA